MSASEVAMKIVKLVLRCLFMVFMGIQFLISGIIINGFQFILYLTLYDRSRRWYRKINYYLIYATWTQIVTMGQWWSGSSVRRWGKKEDLEKFGKEHCIIVMNHKYDTDWLMCWLTCEDLGMLGNAKSCAKKSLKKVPVIGWGWIFGEMIFLERSWEKDKRTLGAKLDNLASYDDPIMILYFCEGTRFTPEKHVSSMEFARANNLPLLQHHLSPRTRGFNFTVRHLKDKIPAVYDVQLAFPEGDVKPTFSNMLRGHSFVGDLHIKRYPMSEIPTDSDESVSKWLHDLYVEKDKLMDDYFKTSKFPGICEEVKPRVYPALNTLLWTCFIGLPFTYFLVSVLTVGSVVTSSVAVSIIVLVFSIIYYMVRATSSARGSSYGKSPKKSNDNNSTNHENTNGNANNDVLRVETAGISRSIVSEQGDANS